MGVYTGLRERWDNDMNINKKEEMVSIIMPSYNTGKYIAQSIQSVINQTYQSWELIIVDDHSEDDTVDIVRRFKDRRIKLFRAKKNCGAARCRNKALYEAQGKWIAFLDSDDLWYPEKLSRQISFMKKRQIKFSYTKYEKIGENSERLGICVSGPNVIKEGRMSDYCWPGCLTVMYDADILPGKLHIKDIRKNNDYAMWLILTRYANCFLLDDILAGYRVRKGSISREKYIFLIKWHFTLFHDVEKMTVLKSYYCMMRNLFFGTIKKIFYEKRI